MHVFHGIWHQCARYAKNQSGHTESRVRLGEERNRANVAVDFPSLFVVVGAGSVEEC